MTTAWQSSAWITVTEEDASIVLRLGGDIDMAACDDIGPALMAAAEQSDSILIDLADVAFLDSTGLALVINASVAAAEHGNRLRVARPQPGVRRLFAIADLQHLLIDG